MRGMATKTTRPMRLGMAGLGRMGANMVTRLVRAGTGAWGST